MAKDNRETNPLTKNQDCKLNDCKLSCQAEQFFCVPLSYCSPPGRLFPIKFLALSAKKNPQNQKTPSKGFSLHRDKIQTLKSTSRMIWLQYPYSICTLFTPSQTHLSSGNCTCTLLFIHPSSNLCMVACLLVIVQLWAHMKVPQSGLP